MLFTPKLPAKATISKILLKMSNSAQSCTMLLGAVQQYSPLTLCNATIMLLLRKCKRLRKMAALRSYVTDLKFI